MSSTRLRIVFALAALAAFSVGSIIGTINARAIAGALPAQASSDGARRVKPDEVRELLKQNKAVLVDVRGEPAYKAGHIKGALLIPVNEIGDRAKELPRDKMIVTYCSWPAEHSSAGAVRILKEKGIDNAAAALGGYDALVKAGLPTERSNWSIDKVMNIK